MKTLDHTVTLTRKDFASDEEWLRARFDGGTFTLPNGIRVGITRRMEATVTDVDFDTAEGPWSVSFDVVDPVHGPERR